MIFEGDSWDEVRKIACEEITNVMDWLINVASSEFTVGTTMRVLGVMFDYRLHVSSIVKKKIHAQRKISSDLSQAELLYLDQFFVLYYAAGTWLNEVLQEKLLSIAIVFRKKRK